MIAALLCVGLVHAAAGTGAPIVDPDVREAVSQYKALLYADVVPLLGRALAKPDLSDTDRDTALAYLGRTYAIFQRSAEAESTFVELLKRQPSFAPSSRESPRIAKAYQDAKTRLDEERRQALMPPVKPPLAPVTTDLSTNAFSPPPPEAKSSHTALWVGAGVVVVATVAVLLIWRPWHDDKQSDSNQPSLGRWELP